MIVYKPEDQSEIASNAASIFSKLESSLPRVPWFSHSGQQSAFREIVELFCSEINELEADADSKDAILFWVLFLTYANKRSYRVATTSLKRVGASAFNQVANSWIDWIGLEEHPGVAVNRLMPSWRERR